MSKIEDVSEAIADETEIAAIEEAGIIAQSQSAEDDGNPADRRLPLIARIYGIVMLIEGVVTLPIIVISCLYAVHAALSGKLAFGALNLTTILSVIHAAVLLVSTACLAIFGMLLILNKRRHIAQWTYLMIPLTLAEGLLSLSLQGLGVNLISPTVQLLVLVALHITADPSLREERRLQFALRRLDARSEYETAVSKGMAGRDLTGKGYISLDFFNLFWLFVVGCVFGLVVETLYHYVLFGEWQDRAGFLWGAVLADLRLWRGDPDGIAQPLVAVELDADLLRQRGDWRRVRIFHQLVYGGCVRYSRVGLHGSMAVD